jgi:hypothetical protein
MRGVFLDFPALITRGEKTPLDNTGGVEAGSITGVPAASFWLVVGRVKVFVKEISVTGVVTTLTRADVGAEEGVAVGVAGCFCR